LKLFTTGIEKALQPGADLLDSIVAVDERRQQYGQFHRDVTLDLSTRKQECLEMHYRNSPLKAVVDCRVV
jgi:hypothetical protein